MDIRDITEEMAYPEGSALSVMIELQKELIDHYVSIEGLPNYPVDINTKSSQVLIKDFVGRIIEELGEAWESYEIMMAMDKSKPELIIPHLQNYNEEVADALHFWLELLIFTGINTSDFSTFLKQKSSDLAVVNPNRDLLRLLMGYADQEIGIIDTPSITVSSYVLPAGKGGNNLFLMGGRNLGKTDRDIQKMLLWDITFHLQIARNTLKNKPWKQTGMMTDETLYKTEIMRASFALFKFMAFAEFTPESIFYIYFKKNRVNKFRIASKY